MCRKNKKVIQTEISHIISFLQYQKERAKQLSDISLPWKKGRRELITQCYTTANDR